MLIHSLKKVLTCIFIPFSGTEGLEIVELSQLETSGPSPLGSHPLLAIGRLQSHSSCTLHFSVGVGNSVRPVWGSWAMLRALGPPAHSISELEFSEAIKPIWPLPLSQELSQLTQIKSGPSEARELQKIVEVWAYVALWGNIWCLLALGVKPLRKDKGVNRADGECLCLPWASDTFGS